jgi:hypothetical protein
MILTVWNRPSCVGDKLFIRSIGYQFLWDLNVHQHFDKIPQSWASSIYFTSSQPSKTYFIMTFWFASRFAGDFCLQRFPNINVTCFYFFRHAYYIPKSVTQIGEIPGGEGGCYPERRPGMQACVCPIWTLIQLVAGGILPTRTISACIWHQRWLSQA